MADPRGLTRHFVTRIGSLRLAAVGNTRRLSYERLLAARITAEVGGEWAGRPNGARGLSAA